MDSIIIVTMVWNHIRSSIFWFFVIRWWDGKGIRLLVRVSERTNRVMTNIIN